MQISEIHIKTKKEIFPLSIALIADLHGIETGPIIEQLQTIRPDVIAIAGDVVENDNDPYPLTFFGECIKIADTFFSLGNHERKITDDDINTISATGVRILDNSWHKYKECFCFGGMTSPFVMEWRETQQTRLKHALPYYEWLDEFQRQNAFRILLDHHPENYARVTRAKDIDLILSGHAHGGQVRLFGHGLYAPHQGLFPRYTSGVYENRLVVSRGLSNTKHIPRIGNPKEIVVVNIAN
ncbi:MAG: metallophosphoesterase [Clostridia bacterium]|nr:metallophosphoesterase [Clostridia bacterium]